MISAPKQDKNRFTENELADFQNISIRGNTEVPQVIRIGNAVFRDKNSRIFPLLIPLRDSCCLAVIGDNADKDLN
ncbi:MAG: hypothetical protein V2I97_22880 [Desulfococcaceae bacterium]|jgi:hypothetical protein|nr:hypothetical protein [Desulfococcaceae bacterium]